MNISGHLWRSISDIGWKLHSDLSFTLRTSKDFLSNVEHYIVRQMEIAENHTCPLGKLVQGKEGMVPMKSGLHIVIA